MKFSDFNAECAMYDHSNDFFESNKVASEIEVMSSWLTNQMFMAENAAVLECGVLTLTEGYLTESASENDLEAITEKFTEKVKSYWEVLKGWIKSLIGRFAKWLMKISGNGGMLTAEEAKAAGNLNEDQYNALIEEINKKEQSAGFTLMTKAWNAATNKVSEIKDKIGEAKQLKGDKKAALNKLTSNLTVGNNTLVVKPIGDAKKAVHTKVLVDFLLKANNAVKTRNANELKVLNTLINKAISGCSKGVEITCNKETLIKMANELKETIKEASEAAENNDKEAEAITAEMNKVRSQLAALVASTMNIYKLVNDEAAIVRRAVKSGSSASSAQSGTGSTN